MVAGPADTIEPDCSCEHVRSHVGPPAQGALSTISLLPWPQDRRRGTVWASEPLPHPRWRWVTSPIDQTTRRTNMITRSPSLGYLSMCRRSTSIKYTIATFDRPLGTACGSVYAGYMRAAQEMSTDVDDSTRGLALGMCDAISVVQDARQRRRRAPTTTSSPGPGDRVQRIHAVPWRGPGLYGV